MKNLFPEVTEAGSLVEKVRRMEAELSPKGYKPSKIHYVVCYEGPKRSLRRNYVRKTRSWKDVRDILLEASRPSNAGVDTLHIKYAIRPANA